VKGSRGGASMSIVGAVKKTRKDLAINIQCPQCNAWPGDRCVGVPRKNVHHTRFEAWRKREAQRAQSRKDAVKDRAPVEQPSFLKGLM